MHGAKFVYTVGDRQYILVPEVRASKHRVWLLGAGMYSLDEEYIGYWHRSQMPVPLIRGLTAHWKNAVATTRDRAWGNSGNIRGNRGRK